MWQHYQLESVRTSESSEVYFNTSSLYAIRGFHGGENSNCVLLGYDAMYSEDEGVRYLHNVANHLKDYTTS
jgi:hypothetical protein